MQIELKVPSVGESITEVEIGQWLKNEGDAVTANDNLVVIESEKTTLELPSPAAGALKKILKRKGETAKVGEVIGYLDQNGAPQAAQSQQGQPAPSAQPKSEPAAAPQSAGSASPAGDKERVVMPAAARVMAEHGIKAENVSGSGPGGRVLKEDVLKQVDGLQKEKAAPAAPSPMPPAAPAGPTASKAAPGAEAQSGFRQEQVVPMTRLRKTLAERLVQAQQNAALLTTFNEVDMSEVMNLRKQYQDQFVQKYGLKLGFMSFFVKAVVDALRLIPQVNAEIRGTDIVYRNYFDIGVAVGGGKGLVVPVLRNAERLSFAQIETAIGEFAKKAKENKLTLEELQGGTFTISNGGVYGSLLSTPIVNPPQSGILGMHAIQERPIALDGQVVIRPMMYIALTYDHRIVDGREAVTFLKRIKEVIENPTRILLEV
jgi:2-oxoglutarate dehydrogenase E2 component (dihydrolipoamide succinyltransferase)